MFSVLLQISLNDFMLLGVILYIFFFLGFDVFLEAGMHFTLKTELIICDIFIGFN
jgi:hypothetical protein